MTKFIFHGGGVDPKTNSDDSFYKELVKNVPENGTVLLVYFASRSDENSEKIALDTGKCIEFSEGKSLRIIVATPEDFLDQVAVSDAIYFRGGSTEKLLTILHMYPNLKEKLLGKTLSGSSAGAYALSTYFSSHYEDSAAVGLGIAPVRVVTHFESSTMPPNNRAVEALKNIANEMELIVLREGEWKVIEV
jgi:peptidase E